MVAILFWPQWLNWWTVSPCSSHVSNKSVLAADHWSSGVSYWRISQIHYTPLHHTDKAGLINPRDDLQQVWEFPWEPWPHYWPFVQSNHISGGMSSQKVCDVKFWYFVCWAPEYWVGERWMKILAQSRRLQKKKKIVMIVKNSVNK